MIVDCAHYRDGRRVNEEPLTLERASALAAEAPEPGFVWIGVVDPDAAELGDLQQRFGLNELAVEDAQSPHLLPKIELYGDLLFAVVSAAQYDDERERVTLGEVAIFLTRRFVLTVRRGEMSPLHPAREQLERRPDLLRLGPSAVMWALVDKIVDDYEPVVAGLEEDISQVEQTVFGGSVAATERIYRLRGQTSDFYRAIHPLLAPLESLQRGIYPQLAPELEPFFRDVSDHLTRVNDDLLAQRDALTSVFQANLAAIAIEQNKLAVRQNAAMKTLTIIATIFLPLSFVVGFFGQNFDWMSSHVRSLPAFLGFGGGALVASCLALWVYFRRTGMLDEDGDG